MMKNLFACSVFSICIPLVFLLAPAALSAQATEENPFHSVFDANFGRTLPTADASEPNGNYYHFGAVLYYDFVGLTLGIDHMNTPLHGKDDFSIQRRSTAILAGLSGTLPLWRRGWHPSLDVHLSVGGLRGDFRRRVANPDFPGAPAVWDGTPVFSFGTFGYGAQLRLPVISNKLFVSLRLQQVDTRGKTPFDALNYGIGLSYEHRARAIKD